MLDKVKKWLRIPEPLDTTNEIEEFKKNQREIERKLASLGVNRDVLTSRLPARSTPPGDGRSDAKKPKSN